MIIENGDYDTYTTQWRNREVGEWALSTIKDLTHQYIWLILGNTHVCSKAEIERRVRGACSCFAFFEPFIGFLGKRCAFFSDSAFWHSWRQRKEIEQVRVTILIKVTCLWWDASASWACSEQPFTQWEFDDTNSWPFPFEKPLLYLWNLKFTLLCTYCEIRYLYALFLYQYRRRWHQKIVILQILINVVSAPYTDLLDN